MKKLQELFDHMYDQHGLILLQSEMFDIIDIVNKIQEKESKSNWCQSCNQVFSDDLVDGKCSECRPKLCWTCGIGDINKDILCNNPECSNFPFK